MCRRAWPQHSERLPNLYLSFLVAVSQATVLCIYNILLTPIVAVAACIMLVYRKGEVNKMCDLPHCSRIRGTCILMPLRDFYLRVCDDEQSFVVV